MQRLFTMFPRGLPGVALLLLRASVAGALLFEQYAWRDSLSTGTLLASALVSLALSAGCFTPVAAVIALLLHGLVWFQLGAMSTAWIVISVLDVAALSLIGPGAFSLDAWRFGRRVVVIPTP